MKPLKDATAVVVDHGRFVHVARCLGEQMGKVYYVCPDERDCPVIREACVGDGFPEIEKISSLEEGLKSADIVVFTDIGFVEEQMSLIRRGVPVWGPGWASKLESNKGFFLDELETCGLPVPPHTVIEGLDDLREHLKDEEDKYIKISKFRGDWETLHWTNYDEMQLTLDSYSVRFGPMKNHLTFYVFDHIETEIEDGIDTWFVGGQWPKNILHGMECKDKAFLGTIQPFDSVPDETRVVNEKFAQILKTWSTTGGMKFSTEVRITKDRESFFIDPTARFGSPPSQGECLLIKNLPEVIYRGAMGQMVEPEWDEKFVVQAAVTLHSDRTEWNSFKLKDSIHKALKGGHCCWVDDMLALPPITEYHSKEVGYLCATGNTIRSAIKSLSKLKDDLPSGMCCEFSSLADLLKEVIEAEKMDMPFTDGPVPEPSMVVDS